MMWVSRMIKTQCNKAAGSMVTEAYPLGYVAGRRTTENAVRWRFHHPERGRLRVAHRRLR